MGLFDKAKKMAKGAALDVAQRAVDAASERINVARWGIMPSGDYTRESGGPLSEHAPELLARPTDEEWRTRLRESYERSMAEFMPMPMRAPSYDLSTASFPFGAREYPTLVIPHRSQETGEVVWSETNYCADPAALEEVCKVISTLEFIEEQALLGIPAVPVLKTDLKLMKPATSCNVVPDENRATLSVNPLTPTGRKPKYPVSVSFNSYRQFYGKPSVGSHGTIDFLPDATPAKADIYYWLSGEGYAASFRLVGDMPTLTLLRTIGEESFVVYRLER